jgi:predicted nucleic acid-binding protein
MAAERLIVCNTSPVINLAETGLLDLLEELPGIPCIPPAVHAELLAKSGLFPAAALAADSGRLRLVAPANGLLVRGFSSSLHRGESECLALGMELPGSLLVLDDLSARTVAAANALPFAGTLGILARAKRSGRLPLLAPVLRDLRIRARFWISPQLERRMLEDAGEAR